MDADTKVKVTFTQTRVVEDQHAGTANESRFEAGKTYELSPRSADRWVKRGVAKWASDEDAAIGAGASSDVALNLQDRDRVDPNAQKGPVVGTGTATDGQGDGDGAASGGDGANYDSMKGDDLKALADERGVKAAGTKKADYIKALERSDVVNKAVADGDWDTLHVDELRYHAEANQIDLTGHTSKPDIIEAIKAPKASA